MTDELIVEATAFRGELVARARGELGLWADAAEDVVQEAYIQLIDRAAAGQAPRSPRAWLHAVVRSRCADERRRRARERPDDLASSASPTPGPDETAAVIAEMRWSLAQVAALPANEREAILDQVAGRSAGESARDTRTANAVYQALYRGRGRLRQAREAAWSLLLPAPLRLWASRTATALPQGTPHGGLGGLGGAVAIAGISALGIAGGVRVAMVVSHPQHSSTRIGHAAPGVAEDALTVTTAAVVRSSPTRATNGRSVSSRPAAPAASSPLTPAPPGAGSTAGSGAAGPLGPGAAPAGSSPGTVADDAQPDQRSGAGPAAGDPPEADQPGALPTGDQGGPPSGPADATSPASPDPGPSGDFSTPSGAEDPPSALPAADQIDPLTSTVGSSSNP